MFSPDHILLLFVSARTMQFVLERTLSFINRRYYLDEGRQKRAMQILEIKQEDWVKALEYSKDRFRFGMIWSTISFSVIVAALSLGILGQFEAWASSPEQSTLLTGIKFFAFLGLASFFLGLPAELYSTFVIEQKHGFNRQTIRTFILDKIKALILMAALGGCLLYAILYIMERMGERWWIYAWLVLTAFSIFTAWIFPTVLAPLFNKFTPLADGELKDLIDKLTKKVGFNASGVMIMDASKRSSHGNAYFTGVFGAKKIVLFDTLVEAMSPREIVSVLAHELGHFKLHHVRWGLLRGVVSSGILLFVLSKLIPLPEFYQAFGLAGISSYGALATFSLWFGLFDFYLQPIESSISRRNEFAADRFAVNHVGNAQDLSSALLKLREKSFAMPLSHPLFSAIYHSHPPLLERIESLKKFASQS